jgi:hypothetical protein
MVCRQTASNPRTHTTSQHAPSPVKFLPAQPVDATPSNHLIRQYFLYGTDVLRGIQSKPKQGFVLFELPSANEIRLVDSQKKTLS